MTKFYTFARAFKASILAHLKDNTGARLCRRSSLRHSGAPGRAWRRCRHSQLQSPQGSIKWTSSCLCWDELMTPNVIFNICHRIWVRLTLGDNHMVWFTSVSSRHSQEIQHWYDTYISTKIVLTRGFKLFQTSKTLNLLKYSRKSLNEDSKQHQDMWIIFFYYIFYPESEV